MKTSHRLWLALILLGAFTYRLYRLGAVSLWYDETVSVYLARLDLVSLTRHTAGDIHPPFYYYLLHFWGGFAGWSEFSSAFLSLFFGILIIALVHRLARDLIPPPARGGTKREIALLAAFFVAISPYNLWYSQEVRMYTLGAFLGLASVYLFACLVGRSSPASPRRVFLSWEFAAYAIVSVLGMYTLYYFAFLLVFENLAALVWVMGRPRLGIGKLESKTQSSGPRVDVSSSKNTIITWAASQFAILVLFLPWLSIAYRQATDPPVPPWRTFVSLPNVLLESFAALTLGQSVDWQTPSWVWIVICIAALAAAAGLWSQTDGNKFSLDPFGLSLAAWTCVPLATIYLLSLWKPLYHVRYVFTYSPPFYILLAAGLDKVANSRWRYARLGMAILSLLLVVGSAISARNYWFDPQYADDDLRGAVKHIAADWRPGDAVLINAGYTYTAFLYYFDQPIAWRGRLTDYESSLPRFGVDGQSPTIKSGAVVLQTGTINGASSLGWGSPESDFFATTADATRAALDRVFAAHPRVWMLRLYDTVVDPDGIVRDYFAQHARLIDDEGFAGLSYARAQGYLTTKGPLTLLPPSVVQREILLGNRIAFLGYEPQEVSARAGEPINVSLYWRAKEATNIDEHVFLGLYGEDGKLAAAADELPLGNGLGTSRWGPDEIIVEPARLSVPRGLPPGNYTLRIQMYNPLTNEPLAAEKSEWVMDGSLIQIVTVQIAP